MAVDEKKFLKTGFCQKIMQNEEQSRILQGGRSMFSAADCRKVARQALAGNWGWAILISFVSMLLSVGVSQYFSDLLDVAEQTIIHHVPFYFPVNWNLLWAAISFLFCQVILLGAALFFIQVVLGQAPHVKVMFSRFSIWPKALGLYIFMGFFVFLWSLLLLVPGIIASFRYSMAVYLMAENTDLGIREAVNLSKQMMQGNKGRLFCLYISFIGWALLSVVTFGIGLFFLAPYMNAATAAFYLNLQNRVTLADAPQPAKDQPALEDVENTVEKTTD